MAPSEALYGQKCRTPLNWVESRERRYYGIDFVTEAEEQVRIIQQHMKAAQSRQKSYADKRRRPIKFEVGDYVYLKVSPMKKVQRFGVKRKLAPRYVGPYKIIERSGRVAYKLQLPPEMQDIFNVFHVSQLKRCLRVPDEAFETTNIKLQSDLTYEERPIQVLEEMERVTWSKVIKFYKVVWNNHGEQDAMWERDDYLCEVYPAFYEKGEWQVIQILGRDFYKGEGL